MKNIQKISKSVFKLSAIAYAVSLSTSSLAEETTKTEADEMEVIQVTGTRGALISAHELKRSADTVVDSITATDIGAFPDKSIAEAIQRIPGVTINRFSASDDTSHFSADPSGAIIRGLTHTSTQFNGRDSFSASSSRGLSFADISPELMAGVDVYKNATAEMIEGGIAGVVNLRTRTPFDADGEVISGSFNLNYGDIRKEATPEGSILYSNRWDTSLGEFGFLTNVSYSDIATTSQAVQYGRMGVYQGVYGERDENTGELIDKDAKHYIPTMVKNTNTEYDRVRRGTSLGLQWQDPSKKIEAIFQYNRSQYEEVWNENTISSTVADMFGVDADFTFTPDGDNFARIPRPAPGGSDFIFDDEGNFQSGTLTNVQQDNGWWGVDDAQSANIALNESGEAMLHPCYTWQGEDCGAENDARGPDLFTISRYDQQRRVTEDASLNVKWAATDRLSLNFDVQYIKAQSNGYNVEVAAASYANISLDTTGGRPIFDLSDPTNVNQSAGALTNANNYRYNHAMDHLDEADGEQQAFRVDADYLIDTDWLNTLSVGVRHAKREQLVKYSAFNWGNIANHWGPDNQQAPYWNIDKTESAVLDDGSEFSGYQEGLYEVRSFGNDFFGNGSQDFAFFDNDILAQRDLSGLSYDSLGVGAQQWNPICSGGGMSATSGRLQELDDSCFRPDELNDVSETTSAVYAMLKFGGTGVTLFGAPVSGNIGVRWVETINESDGAVVFPNLYSITPTSDECTRALEQREPDQPADAYAANCYLSADDLAYASGTGDPRTAKTTHHHLLPSLNISFELTDDWLLRLAASKALSRPDIGLMKNYLSVRSDLPGRGTQDSDERYVTDADGKITGVNPRYLGSAYNPSLKPVTAKQFDVSLEHYFEDGGMFALAAFHKDFDDFIQYSSRDEQITQNGITRTVTVKGPLNGEGAAVYGAEASITKFFNFLPGAWSGLGLQLNASVIKNKGSNSGVKNQNGGDAGGGAAQGGTNGTTLEVDDLEGLSKYNFNLVGMYEKYGFNARLAYNWRSEYLITAVDCCTNLPTYNEGTGYLDGSISYQLTDEITVSLQGSNLLDTQPVLAQQVSDASEGSLKKSTAWLRNDRRFVLGVRARF